MPVQPPARYLPRPARLDDAEAIAALANANAAALVGEPWTSGDELRSALAAPGPSIESRSTVLTTADGELCASLLLEVHPPFTAVTAYGEVAARHRGRGLGTYLVARAAELAPALVTAAAPGTRPVLRWDAWVGAEGLFELLGRHGFAPVRHFWRMRMALDDPPAAPAWPPGIAVRTFRPGDERRVYEAHAEAFRDHWGDREQAYDHFLHDTIEGPAAQFDPSLWFLALAGEDVAGFAICQADDATEPGAGYVRDLGVRSAFRRRGIALALLRHAFGALHRRGHPAVALHVDADNPTGALRLYESAGMTAHPRFQLWERPLARP